MIGDGGRDADAARKVWTTEILAVRTHLSDAISGGGCGGAACGLARLRICGCRALCSTNYYNLLVRKSRYTSKSLWALYSCTVKL